jgi:hypothetical protein
MDVEWRIGSTHAFDGGGPGFDSAPAQDGIFSETLISGLKTINLCDVML